MSKETSVQAIFSSVGVEVLRVIKDYGLVRVISTADSKVIVEVRDQDKASWDFHSSYNLMSDDYAYTNAMEAAGRAIKDIAQRKAEAFV